MFLVGMAFSVVDQTGEGCKWCSVDVNEPHSKFW